MEIKTYKTETGVYNSVTRIKSNNYTPREETFENRKHLVVPVIMMVEGVHSGSHGPLYHSIEELGKYPDSWNGIPVTNYHPEIDGENVSANSPMVLESNKVGQIFNTHVDGNKLKAEVWLDEELLQKNSTEIYEAIKEGKELEVSIGVFTDEVESTGQWNGEEYVSIATNHRPDHLAILPREIGACSHADGCGIRTNSKQDIKKSLSIQGYSFIKTNMEGGLKEILEKVRQKLDSMDSDMRTYYCHEVYEDYLIYQVHNRNTNQETYYKTNYSYNEGEVEFEGEPEEVRIKMQYELINNKIQKNMAKEEKCIPCEEKVNALIANKSTKFTEDDKDWLLTLKEEALEKLISEKQPEKVNTNSGISKEQAIQVLKESFKSKEDFLNIVPSEFKESFESGLKLHEEKKASMIKSILDNTEEVWSEESLKAMDNDTLNRVYKSIPQPVDYSAQNTVNNNVNVNSADDVLLPAGVEVE